MNAKRIISRMEEAQQYYRNIEDRNVIGALNNIYDILKVLIDAVDDIEERHQSEKNQLLADY